MANDPYVKAGKKAEADDVLYGGAGPVFSGAISRLQLLDEADRAMSVESTAWMARYGQFPSAPSNRFTVLAYDEYLVVIGTSKTAESYPPLEGVLGMFDQMAIQVVVDQVKVPAPGTDKASLTVQMQHSAEGRTWMNKKANPEVSSPAFLNLDGETAMEPGYDPGVPPTLGYARFIITLTGTSAPTSARIKVYVTCNDYRERNFTTLVRQRRKIWRHDFGPIIKAHLLALQGKSPNPSGESNGC